MADGYTDTFVEVAETKLHLLRGGQGEPLLILHGAGGNRGWLAVCTIVGAALSKFMSPIIQALGNRISQNGSPLSLIWRVFTSGPWRTLGCRGYG